MNSLDIELTDNGAACKTPCGQDGLFKDRYWCHTSDSWDFCTPKHHGQFISYLAMAAILTIADVLAILTISVIVAMLANLAL